MIVLGAIAPMIEGSGLPVLGILLTKILFTLMKPDLEVVREDADYYCTLMGILSVVMGLAVVFEKTVFGITGENITLKMRETLYESIIKKHIGFFDDRDNSPGILTTVLA